MTFTKLDRHMPEYVRQTKLHEINQCTDRLNDEMVTQEHLDQTYLDFADFIKDETKT